MFCKYCGKQLEDGSAFCKYCGKALNEVPAATPAPQHTVSLSMPVTETNQTQQAQTTPEKMPFMQHLKATCKLLSFSGWASLVVVVPAAAMTVLFVLTAIVSSIQEATISPLFGYALLPLSLTACVYFFGIHQFWNAAAVENKLSFELPKEKSETEWLAYIRDNFSFEGAVLADNQPDNTVVYLLHNAQMWLTAENGVLRITVKHSRRFNSASSGGHWELEESFAADNLKCALTYFVHGQPLPATFGQEQKKKHKNKVGNLKVGIVAAVIVAVLIVLFIPSSESPLSSLKNSIWDNYSTTQTIGEAFAENFENAKWTSHKVDGGTMAVFTGVIDLTEDLESLGVYDADDETAKIPIEMDFLITETSDYYHYQLENVYLNDIQLPAVYENYSTIFLQYGFDGDGQSLLEMMYYLDM